MTNYDILLSVESSLTSSSHTVTGVQDNLFQLYSVHGHMWKKQERHNCDALKHRTKFLK